LADEQGNQQDDVASELFDLYQFTTWSHALGVPAPKVAGDFLFGLERLRQRGVIPLEEMAMIHATTGGEEAASHPEQWAAGFAAGYRSAWAAAVLRVLDTRGVEFSKELHRGVHVCPDVDVLTRFLDRAVTATHQADLVTEVPGHRSPDGP
jgi:hypothetical protein